MTQREMVEQVSEKCGVTQREAERILRASAELIAAEATKGEQIRFFDLGTFKVVTRKAKVGRNPQTGETIRVPEHAAVKFDPSAGLKRAVAGGAAGAPRLRVG